MILEFVLKKAIPVILKPMMMNEINHGIRKIHEMILKLENKTARGRVMFI